MYPVDDPSPDARLEFFMAAEKSLSKWVANNIEIESAEESDRRRKLVFQLTYIFRDWVRDVCLSKGWSEEEAAQVRHASISFPILADVWL